VLTAWLGIRCLYRLVLVWKQYQHNKADDPKQTEGAKVRRQALTLRVLHTPPDQWHESEDGKDLPDFNEARLVARLQQFPASCMRRPSPTPQLVLRLNSGSMPAGEKEA
jgi:hypothetical protein